MTRVAREHLRLLHSSDIHLGQEHSFPPDGRGHTGMRVASAMLQLLVEVANARAVDVVLLAGDIFDHNRVPDDIVREAGETLSRSQSPVVILPGNHDPLTPDSVYLGRRHYLPEDVKVLGVDGNETLVFEDLALRVWGRPHASYDDFRPLAQRPDWGERAGEHWRVAVGHGHLVRTPWDERHSYQIRANEIEALDADYLALGHWDIHESVGTTRAPAYYSGSPCRIGSFTLVDLGPTGVAVREVHPE